MTTNNKAWKNRMDRIKGLQLEKWFGDAAQPFAPSVPTVYISLSGIFLIGLWLRWFQLLGNLYADEVWVITTAASSFPNFVQEIIEDWVHPPLFHFIVRGWIYLFGFSDLSGQLVSITFGVLSIPLIYWLGKEILGQRTGLVAAALLAFSPAHIHHSQYGRHYTVFVFFVLLSMTAFLRVCNQLDNRRYAVFYVFSTVLLVYTHYFGWLVVLCQGLFFLVRRWSHFKRWALLQIIIVLSYLPWILLIAKTAWGSRPEQYIGWIKPTSLLEPIYTLGWFNGQLPFVHQQTLGLLLMGGMILLSLKGIYHKDKHSEAVLFLISCVVVPFVLVFIVSRTVQPVWLGRTMFVSLPAYYLLIAVGSQRIEMKGASLLLILVLMTWMGLASLHNLRSDHRLPFEQIANYLASESESEIPILVENTYLANPLYFYYRGKGFVYELRENNVSVVPVSHKGSLSHILTQISEGQDRLILVTYTPAVKGIQSELASVYRVVKQKVFLGRGEEEGNWREVSIFFYEKI